MAGHSPRVLRAALRRTSRGQSGRLSALRAACPVAGAGAGAAGFTAQLNTSCRDTRLCRTSRLGAGAPGTADASGS